MKWGLVITLLIISSDVFSQVRGTTWGESWEEVEEMDINYNSNMKGVDLFD